MLRSLLGVQSIRSIARQTITKPILPVSFSFINRQFSSSPIAYRINTSTRTKENVHDLETFLTLIGRNCIEHKELFENDLETFLATTSKKMKNMGIDTRTRRYLLRWKHKFVNDLEPLREHKRGVKKNGGERKAKAVLARKKALARREALENAGEETEDRIF
ncbi:FYV4 [[Candida] subhashii]|uniref:Small ribosomal subunit protein mS41 n=1 Tax=[Candida] subhashii TaxID=561895 RepID=A0A8J5UXK4_9ASCO|nr:FYV4 [[Candida] subhashii]KAG7662389.1 FYV4 [[Candida] subhashii]